MVPGMVALAGINSPEWSGRDQHCCRMYSRCSLRPRIPRLALQLARLNCRTCACAARANERCRFRRSGGRRTREHETAAMVRTDERRKKSSGNDSDRMLSLAALSF